MPRPFILRARPDEALAFGDARVARIEQRLWRLQSEAEDMQLHLLDLSAPNAAVASIGSMRMKVRVLATNLGRAVNDSQHPCGHKAACSSAEPLTTDPCPLCGAMRVDAR